MGAVSIGTTNSRGQTVTAAPVSVRGDIFNGSGFGYLEHSYSDEEVTIIACHIGRLTVAKEVVTTDRSGSVGKVPKLLPVSLRRW